MVADALPLFIAIQRKGLTLLEASISTRQECRDVLENLKKSAQEQENWPCVLACERYLALDAHRHRRQLINEAEQLQTEGDLDEAWRRLLLAQFREGTSSQLEFMLQGVDHERRQRWYEAARTGAYQRVLPSRIKASDEALLARILLFWGYANDEKVSLQNGVSQLIQQAAQWGFELHLAESAALGRLEDAFHPGLHNWDSIVVVTALQRIDDSLLKAAELIIVVKVDEHRASPRNPRCSLITTLFRSELDLDGFLENVAMLDGYGRSLEHLFVVARPSLLESTCLIQHLQQFAGVVILWLRQDPGLYASWNLAIAISKGAFLSNANVDDRRDPSHVRILLGRFEQQPEVVVAASWLRWIREGYTGDEPQLSTADPHRNWRGFFGLAELALPALPGNHRLIDPNNLPHCMPVWRRCLHQRYGLFREDLYGTFADWAFWMRVMSGGEKGWLEPAELGSYLIRANSHNRRSLHLVQAHQRIEDEFYGLWNDAATSAGLQDRDGGTNRG